MTKKRNTRVVGKEFFIFILLEFQFSLVCGFPSSFGFDWFGLHFLCIIIFLFRISFFFVLLSDTHFWDGKKVSAGWMVGGWTTVQSPPIPSICLSCHAHNNYQRKYKVNKTPHIVMTSPTTMSSFSSTKVQNTHNKLLCSVNLFLKKYEDATYSSVLSTE